jgi:hypothetical protein
MNIAVTMCYNARETETEAGLKARTPNGPLDCDETPRGPKLLRSRKKSPQELPRTRTWDSLYTIGYLKSLDGGHT